MWWVTELLPGITGQMYRQFAVTICVAVVFSSVNALTLSPALSATLLRPPGEQKKSLFDGFFSRFNDIFERVAARFVVATEFFTSKLIRMGILLAALVACMVLLFRLVPAA